MDKTIKEILANFADSLKDLIKAGFITTEHFESTNRKKLNETHSLVCGALSNSVHSTLGTKYVIQGIASKQLSIIVFNVSARFWLFFAHEKFRV
jgi:hypothetical protein